MECGLINSSYQATAQRKIQNRIRSLGWATRSWNFSVIRKLDHPKSRPAEIFACSCLVGNASYSCVKMLRSCFRPVERYFFRGMADRGDTLIWHKDLKPHNSGDFSMAVVQANSNLEDQGQVQSSHFGTYIGVYDGHGGPEASRFINNHLFPHMESMYLSILLYFFCICILWLILVFSASGNS